MDQVSFTIEQVRELADRYESSGLAATSAGRFLRSIATESRMPRGGGVSWLNDLMQKGLPEDAIRRANEIEELAARSNRKDTAATLRDFASRIRCGRQLTERQQKFLDVLIRQVVENKPDLQVEGRDKELLAGLRTHKMLGSAFYWCSRPGTSSRLDAIFKRWSGEGLISQDDWEFVRSSFKSIVEEFEMTKHPVGSLRWDPLTPYRDAVIVSSQPYFIDGVVNVDVVCSRRGVVRMPVRALRKRSGR